MRKLGRGVKRTGIVIGYIIGCIIILIGLAIIGAILQGRMPLH